MSAQTDYKSTPPGAVLKAAREEKGLSTAAVAQSLHLRASVVESIEAGQYDEFESLVFLKGYFRSYCRLVGLHEERMAELLEGEIAELRQEKAEQVQAEEKERSKVQRVKLAKGGVAAIIVVMIIAIVAYVTVASFSEDSGVLSEPGVVSEPVSTMPNTVIADESGSDGTQSGVVNSATIGQDVSPDVTAAVGDELQSENAGENRVGESTEAAGESLSDTSESDASTADANTTDASTTDASTTDASTTDASTTDVTNSDPSPAESAPSSREENGTVDSLSASPVAGQLVTAEQLVERPGDSAVEEGLGTLAITFSGDCWVEIRNAAGRRVVAQLKRAGDTLNYTGALPMTLKLGDGRVAALEFNGKAFDLNPYLRRNGVAELELK